MHIVSREFALVFRIRKTIYTLFPGREVHIGKTVVVLITEGTVFPITDRPRPENNLLIFFATVLL